MSYRMPQPDTRPEDRMKIVRRLLSYIGRHRWRLAVALILTLSANFLSLVGPALSGKAIDAIGIGPGEADIPLVLRYALMMVIFYILSAGFQYILSMVMVKLSQKVIVDLRNDVFDHLMSLPVRYFDSNQVGDIVSRMSYDIDTMNSSLTNDLVMICASMITVVGSFIAMFTISPVLILIFLFTVPLSIRFVKWRTGKMRPVFRARSRKHGELNGLAEELLSGQKTIKAYHQEAAAEERFGALNEEAIKFNYKANYMSSEIGPQMNFINNLTLSFISVLGSILYFLGSITLGNVSAFVLYSRRFMGPINETANLLMELQSAVSAAERVFRLLDEETEPEDVYGAKELDDVKGHVEMDGVRFGYDPEKIIIKNLDLEAEPGNLVAIVGPTGAGKTTIINLLMRFYDPLSGTIRMDGTENDRITRKSLRGAFAMVLQDTWLFHGTIYDNIRYGRPDATREEVIRAAESARIHSYIMSLPDGYDTVVTENGMNISQGQKQMLTIARAMLIDKKMLILDEATSNVDTRTELEIQSAMRELMKDKTCFVIAHRLSTVRNADTILVISDGDIREKGSHEELMEKNGIYAGLYRSQFK